MTLQHYCMSTDNAIQGWCNYKTKQHCSYEAKAQKLTTFVGQNWRGEGIQKRTYSQNKSVSNLLTENFLNTSLQFLTQIFLPKM